MTPVNFRKTLIALAVSSASLPVYAETLTLTDAGLVEKAPKTHSESVEVIGSYSGGDDAMEFAGVQFDSDLILNAEISTTGDFSGGFDLSEPEGADGVETGEKTLIKGDLINRGNISANGDGSAAMLLDPAIINGSIINEGSLSVTGDALEGESANGLGILDTQVDGDIRNQGDITVEGEKAKGIWVSPGDAGAIGGSLINSGTIRATDSITKWTGEWDDPVTNRVLTGALGIHLEDVVVEGDIVNKGVIEANGERAMGILLEGTRLKGKLINHGTIRVDSERSVGIDTASLNGESAELQQIENHGSIIATGKDSEGMVLSFDSTDPKVINTGTIKADGTAIYLESFGEVGVDNILEIEHRGGLISGNEAAIFAMSGVDLLWSGGKIEGDILLGQGNPEIDDGVVAVSSEEVVVFDGDTIQAYAVDVGGLDEDGAPFTGHLELERLHTTIKGSMGVANGSSLTFNLDNDTDATQPVLTVTDLVKFAEDAEIKLAAKASDFSADGTEYTLIQAGSIENGDSNDNLLVTSHSAMLEVDTFGVDDQRVTATVTAKGAEQVVESIKDQGASGNAQSAIRSFAPLMGALSGGEENDPVFEAFANANASELADLAERLAPETSGGSTTAAVSGQSLVSNVTSSRTSGARQGLSSGEAFQEAGVWAQALYSDANQSLRDGVAGYNAYSRGIAVGADSKVNDRLMLGLAYSFLNTDVNGETGNKTEVDGHSFTLYSGYELGNYFIDANLTYGVNGNESERYIVAGSTAEADYDSSLLGISLMGGYSFRHDSGLLIEPRVAARYSNVQIDSYQETGSSAALKVEDQRYEAAELGVGVRLAGSFTVGQGTLEPQAKLMAYHDFVADRASSTSSFVIGGTPFVTHGAEPVRNSYQAGVGVDYHLGATTVGVGYDYVGKSDFDSQTFVAKVRYDF